MISRRNLNLFETIRLLEHDLDFEPHSHCQPTAARAGSKEKLLVMCERLANGQDMHHPNDNWTSATFAEQKEMADFVIECARTQREESRVRRAEAQPKRVMALHAARATKQREAEVRKTKYLIRTTRGSK